MEKQNTQELRSISDGQKNTLAKDQSKTIDAELAGLPEGKVKQKPVNNIGESLKKNKLDMDENAGWVTTERYSEKKQPNPQTNSHYKSFLNELIRKSAERKSVQNLANGVETDNILSSGNSQSVMINKSLYHYQRRMNQLNALEGCGPDSVSR
ncbi:hypothetical protein ACNZ64_001445 [Enterococcus hirae]